MKDSKKAMSSYFTDIAVSSFTFFRSEGLTTAKLVHGMLLVDIKITRILLNSEVILQPNEFIEIKRLYAIEQIFLLW